MAVNLSQLFRDADEANVRLAVNDASVSAVHGDAVLFDAVQVPVVAFAVVACIVGRRGGESVDVLGARVGHALMAAFPAFGRVGRYLQWSIRVRTVTVEALTFLEESGLVIVTVDEDRVASMTELGRKFLRKLRAANDEAAQLFKGLEAAVGQTRNVELRLL
ncbi:MAG: hypothetical protein AB7T06_33720 [Kofleriaceae bacterium]